MKKQILSFKCAIKGVWNTIKSESHMRFHIIAGIYVLVFSLFYDFSEGQRALLIILIASVMAAETVNTCIEELCNLISDHFEPLVKISKDAAAGAVLILSVAAAAVAVIFFLNFETIGTIISFFLTNPWLIAVLALSAVLSVIFIVWGPVGIRNKIMHLKFTNKNS